jgi:hypothetical protein
VVIIADDDEGDMIEESDETAVSSNRGLDSSEEDEDLVLPVIPSCSQRQVVISTDNAKNVSLAVEQSSMYHIRCFAHTINLSAQKFTKQLDGHLSRIRSIVRFFHNSSTATTLLKVIVCFLYLNFLIPILLWKINYSTCMYIVQYCINGLVFC